MSAPGRDSNTNRRPPLPRTHSSRAEEDRFPPTYFTNQPPEIFQPLSWSDFNQFSSLNQQQPTAAGYSVDAFQSTYATTSNHQPLLNLVEPASILRSTPRPLAAAFDASTTYWSAPSQSQSIQTAQEVAKSETPSPSTTETLSSNNTPSRRSRPFRGQRSRRGPLDTAAKAKIAEVRDSRACWRCRRYKKPCDGDAICKSCLTGGFRVWPSLLGCRRDGLESFVAAILPRNAEAVLVQVAGTNQRTVSWRAYVQQKLLAPGFPSILFSDDSLGRIAHQARSTGMYGDEIDDLLAIIEEYQSNQAVKSPLLEITVRLLSLSLEFYRTFVAVESDELSRPSEDIVKNIGKIRVALSKGFRLYTAHCLSGNRADLCPAVLSMSLICISICIIMDAAFVVPEPARGLVWAPDIYSVCTNIRDGVYPISFDLLRARANDDTPEGPRPLTLDCWGLKDSTVVSPGGGSEQWALSSHSGAAMSTSTFQSLESSTVVTSPNQARDPVGMALVNQNVNAFDRLSDLKTWIEKHRNLLVPGHESRATVPFSQSDVPPISTLSALFGL